MYALTVAHLYPELLNLYGDKGNISSFIMRGQWRNIEINVIEYGMGDEINFSETDIIFLGGGSDREQRLVCNKLNEIKSSFQQYVENDGNVVAICGGYQLLGQYYKTGSETIQGLGILNIVTNSGDGRLIGDIVIETTLFEQKIVGFENHAGRTDIGDHIPLGTVLSGNGNNGIDKTEGVIYKNVIGTYLHGPLLPKNPQLCDMILNNALKKKYGDTFKGLSPLEDETENAANGFIVNRSLGNSSPRDGMSESGKRS